MQYLEIFIAAVAAFMLGFLWYTALFGKIWQAETGITDEQAQSGMGITHGVAFLMMLVISYYLFSNHVNNGTIGHGAYHGMEAALHYAIPLMVINHLYQKKSFKLILIDGGYALAFFSVIGAVIAAVPLHEMPMEDIQGNIDWATEYLESAKQTLEEMKNSGN